MPISAEVKSKVRGGSDVKIWELGDKERDLGTKYVFSDDALHHIVVVENDHTRGESSTQIRGFSEKTGGEIRGRILEKLEVFNGTTYELILRPTKPE